MRAHLVCTCLLLAGALSTTPLAAHYQKLRVADNDRYLVHADGRPFVWIGETNWFFAKLPPATIDSILDVRSAQGITIMFVAAREKLHNGPGPGALDSPNEAWWSYLDEYVAKCAARGMYVGIALGWWPIARKHSPEALRRYGRRVGERYADADNMVWLTLGEAGGHFRKNGPLPGGSVAALVAGIWEGDTGDKLLRVHADFKRGSSLSDHGDLVDFNNWQTSQWCCPDDLPRKDERGWTVWEAMAFDYAARYDGRPKPTLDAEAWYEGNSDFCGATPFNIRRRAYFTILAGGFGHSYGAGGVWDGLKQAEGDCGSAALGALRYEGAVQMGYLSALLHGLGDDLLHLRPAQDLIVSPNSQRYDGHLQAARSSEGEFGLVYSASDAAFRLDLSSMKNDELAAKWFDPRAGTSTDTVVPAPDADASNRRFDPPGEEGPGHDWVLLVGEQSAVERFATGTRSRIAEMPR